MRIVHDGEALRVRDATRPGDDGTLVVTFPARTGRQFLDRNGFGQAFLRKAGISALLVTASWNHWFQVPEADAAAAAMARVCARFRRVVTYGSSMGGYGAALFSRRLGADQIIALSPQFSIDAAKVPGETRWREDAARITFRNDDMAAGLRPDVPLTLFYDPLIGDRAHAERLLALSARPNPVVVPFGGHPVGGFLRDARVLGRLITEAIHGPLDAAAARRLIRASRREVPAYWSNAGIVLARRDPAASVAAAERAVALAPEDAEMTFRLANALARAGCADRAADAFAAARRLNPSRAKYRLAHGLHAAQSGAFAEAEALLAPLAEAFPGDYRLHLGLARSLLGLGRREAAEAWLARARRAGAPPGAWRAVEQLVRAAGGG